MHALAAVLYHQYKEPLKTEYHTEQLVSLLDGSLQPNTPDELLFGRAGYLSSLLFVKKHIPKDVCEKLELDGAMKKVFTRLVESGKEQGLRDGLGRAKKSVAFTIIIYCYDNDDWVDRMLEFVSIFFFPVTQ